MLLPALTAAGAPAEEVVVTGTLSEQSINKMTTPVTVIDRDFIAQSNKRNVADVLRTVPGLLVEEQGGPGGLVSVSIRGGEANFTLVLIDGVEVNDSTNTRGGSFDFGNLNLDSVERIEIVRGTQSAVYGSDALSGVINIITTQAKAGHLQLLQGEVGEDSYWRSGVTLTGVLEQVSYKLQWTGRDSGEPVKDSEQRGDEVNVGLGWQPTAKHQLRLSYRYADGDRRTYPEQSGGPELALSDALYRTDYTDQSTAASWSYQVTDSWLSELKGSWYHRDESYNSPGIVPPMNLQPNVPPNSADSDFKRLKVQWVNRIGNQDYWLNTGVDRRDEKGKSQGEVDFGVIIPTGFKLDRSTNGAFIDLNGQVTASTLLQASVRYDDPDSVESETSYKAGIRQVFADWVYLTANWGEGYKLPSFFALGDPLTGNEDLSPETSESWDITAHFSFGEHTSSLTYFDNQYKNLVTFDDINFSTINSDPIDTSGVEWQWHWRPAQIPLHIQAQMTYTDIDPQNKELLLTGRSEWQAGIYAAWNFTSAWNLSLNYQYVGEQYAGSQHTGNGTITELDSYNRLDAAMYWDVNAVVRINAALDNVFDEHYETAVGFPAIGRSLRVGVRVSL